MKGQNQVLEEMLVFVVAFVVVFNVVLFMQKISSKSESSVGQHSVDIFSERVANMLVKAYIANGTAYFELPPNIGNGIYRISMRNGILSLYSRKYTSTPPLFGFEVLGGDFSEFSPGQFFRATFSNGFLVKRLNIAEFI